jgi:hypothetical protein
MIGTIGVPITRPASARKLAFTVIYRELGAATMLARKLQTPPYPEVDLMRSIDGVTARARVWVASKPLVLVVGLLTSVGSAVHCGGESTGGTPAEFGQTAAAGSDGGGSGVTPGGQLGGEGGPGSSMNSGCVAPDVLIALDRTLTMARRPDGTFPADTPAGHAESKWAMAIDALHHTVVPPLDKGIQFGLELWPKKDTGCLTLQEKLASVAPSNPSCQGSELLVGPALGAGAQISGALDPEKTKICYSTPTGTALLDAQKTLAATKAAGKKQFVILVTDGADWDQTCPTPNPLDAVDALTAAGVGTMVVGFSAEQSVVGGVGRGFLDDMACAGGVSKGFPAGCEKQGAVYRAKSSGGKNPMTPAPLFYSTTNTAELVDALTTFAKAECCDCGVH